MRKPIRAVVALAGVALLTAACGGGSSTGSSAAPSSSEPAATSSAPDASPTTSGPPVRSNADLVIWTDELKAPAVKTVADTFAAANGITVDVQVVSSDLQAAVVTANAAGNGPDVFTGAHDWIGNLVQNGTIDPLQLSAAQVQGYADVAVEATTYNDKLYALPYGIEALALYRNTAVAPDAPKTLDEAFKTGAAAVKAKKVESAFNLQVGDNGDAYHMEPLLTSMGGYMFGTEANGNYDPKDLGIGKAGSIAAAKKIGALGEKGSKVLRRSISGDNSIALFAGGKAAYLVSGPWALADVKKGGIEYAISPIPGFAGEKKAAPFAGVQAFFVSSKGKNKAFAQEFVANAANTEEAMQAMYDGAKLPPALKSLQAKVGSDPDVKTFVDAAAAANPMPAIPAMQAVWEPLGKAYAAIVGGADPTKTITNAGKTINAAIAKAG
ncbi:extracellular solute-binding protein [Kineosporia sp. R_H_3]|uniref:sugar ABC transporter substrate-binding protein n=1 Tax=Kineosporia sp. R_H_3 TaxID=1961848 RepID=UPI000B4B0B03|nr:extracellular solute-binding protein [Kineosporia sp. R_H_3]